MGGIRFTQSMFIDRSLRNLNAALGRAFEAEEQLSTGFRVNRASDDPLDARRAVNLRFQIAKNEQFLSNIEDIRPHITGSATTLQQGVDILQRIRDLTIQAANETNSQEQLDLVATEVNELLESLLVIGNHEANGRFVFAGTRTLTQPFVETRVGGEIASVAYAGNTNDLNVSIQTNSIVPVNVNGQEAFQNAVDIFAVVAGIRDDMRAGNQANLSGTRVDEMDQAIEQLLSAQSALGAVDNRIDRVANNVEEAIIAQRILLSDKVDVDFAEATLEFNNTLNALNASLSASARVLQPTLLDFIR